MQLKTPWNMIMDSMLFLYLWMRVLFRLWEDCFSHLLEFVLGGFVGEFEVVLELWSFFISEPYWILFAHYFFKMADLFVCEKSKFPLLGVWHKIRLFLWRHPCSSWSIGESIDDLGLLPLSPYKITSVHIAIASQWPPRTRLEYTFDQ